LRRSYDSLEDEVGSLVRFQQKSEKKGARFTRARCLMDAVSAVLKARRLMKEEGARAIEEVESRAAAALEEKDNELREKDRRLRAAGVRFFKFENEWTADSDSWKLERDAWAREREHWADERRGWQEERDAWEEERVSWELQSQATIKAYEGKLAQLKSELGSDESRVNGDLMALQRHNLTQEERHQQEIEAMRAEVKYVQERHTMLVQGTNAFADVIGAEDVRNPDTNSPSLRGRANGLIQIKQKYQIQGIELATLRTRLSDLIKFTSANKNSGGAGQKIAEKYLNQLNKQNRELISRLKSLEVSLLSETAAVKTISQSLRDSEFVDRHSATSFGIQTNATDKQKSAGEQYARAAGTPGPNQLSLPETRSSWPVAKVNEARAASAKVSSNLLFPTTPLKAPNSSPKGTNRSIIAERKLKASMHLGVLQTQAGRNAAKRRARLAKKNKPVTAQKSLPRPKRAELEVLEDLTTFDY